MRKATFLSLTFAVFIVLVIVASVGVSERGKAACVGSKPLLQELAAQDPWRQQCYPPSPLPGYCNPAAPPTLTAIGSQEALLQATVPSGFTASSAWWRAEQMTASGPVLMWEFVSTSGIQSGVPGPYTVTFGAPGLTGADPYQFRVSFTDASNGQKLCYSNLSATSFLQGAFSTLPPAPPSPGLGEPQMVQVVEDDFNRQSTTLKCGLPPGDGLGPNEVWGDCASGAGGFVDGTLQIAEFTPLPGVYYDRQVALFSPSYGEMNVRVKSPNGGYNLQSMAAWQPGTFNEAPTIKGYIAKLVLKFRGCNAHPALILAKVPMETNSVICTNGTPQLPGSILIPDTVNGGPKCDAEPPLATSQGGGESRSKPVWIRIKTHWDFTHHWWIVTGTVAWDCPASGSPVPQIDACTHVCATTRIDTQPDGDMTNPGGWGIGFHEMSYHVEMFRAGAWTGQ